MSKVIPTPYSIFGTALYSSWEISDALSSLNVSHSVANSDRTRKELVINLRKPQPHWVHVSPSVKALKPNSYNLICAAHSALKLTNIPLLPDLPLVDALKQVLTSDRQTRLQITRLSAVDYIERVARPSLLNKIQTEMYKIHPYGFRKEVQGLVLEYFNSKIPEAKAIHLLMRSFKTEPLVPLLKEGRELRIAVARLKNESAEVVAASSGFSTFELLYLNRT